jgi:hypothetical protein
MALNVPWHVIQKLLEIELLWMVIYHLALQVAAASLHFAAAVRHTLRSVLPRSECEQLAREVGCGRRHCVPRVAVLGFYNSGPCFHRLTLQRRVSKRVKAV